MLIPNNKFQSDIESKNISIIPLIKIVKGDFRLNLSTNNLSISDTVEETSLHYKPLLNSIPSINQKLDFENRRYTISSVSLSLSNVKYEGARFSDININLLNSEVYIYWKSPSCKVLEECLLIYRGEVRRVNHASDIFNITVEDISQEDLHKELPVSNLGDSDSVLDKYKNKPIPMVYGHVNRSPCVIREVIKEGEFDDDYIARSEYTVSIDSKILMKPIHDALIIPRNRVLNPECFLFIGNDGKYFPISYNTITSYDRPQIDPENINLPDVKIIGEVDGSQSPMNTIGNNIIEVIAERIPIGCNVVEMSSAWETGESHPDDESHPSECLDPETPLSNSFDSNTETHLNILNHLTASSGLGEGLPIFSGTIFNYEFEPTGLDDIVCNSYLNLKLWAKNNSLTNILDFFLRCYNTGVSEENIESISAGNDKELDTYLAEGQTVDLGDPHRWWNADANNKIALAQYYMFGNVRWEGKIYEIAVTNYSQLKDPIGLNYYANIKGRLDSESGTYTGYVPGTRTGGTSRDLILLDGCESVEDDVRQWQGITASSGSIDDIVTIGGGEQTEGDNCISFVHNPTEPGHSAMVYSIANYPYIDNCFEGDTYDNNINISIKVADISTTSYVHIVLGDSSEMELHDPDIWDGGGTNPYFNIGGKYFIGGIHHLYLNDNEWTDVNIRIADFYPLNEPSGVIDFIGITIIRHNDDTGLVSAQYYIDNIVYNGDGIAVVPVYGCTDPEAINFNEEATMDDGSCLYPESPTVNLETLIFGEGYPFGGEEWEDQNLNATPIYKDQLLIDSTNSEVWDYEDNNIVGITIERIDVNSPYTPIVEQVGDQPSLWKITAPVVLEETTFEYKIEVEDSFGYTGVKHISFTVNLYESHETEIPIQIPNDADGLITNPADIIHHILKEEIGSSKPVNTIDSIHARMNHVFKNFYNLEVEENTSWKFAFTQHKKINSKKLIEEISKSSKLFPIFRNNGEFGYKSLQDAYDIDSTSVFEIKEADVIKFSLNKTKIEQVYSRVKVLYKKDYSDDEYKKDTGWKFFHELEQYTGDNSEFYEYHGLDEEIQIEDGWTGGQELIFESDYIRDENTAKALRHFLLGWNINQHLLIRTTLPLNYLKYEVGDIVSFDKIIGDTKAYGEDYTRQLVYDSGEYVFRNYQRIYPLFMIISSNKNIDSVELEYIQLHDWTSSLSRSYQEPTEPLVADFIIDNQVDATDYVIENNIGKTNIIEEPSVLATEFKFTNNTDGNIITTDWIFELENDDGELTHLTDLDVTGNEVFVRFNNIAGKIKVTMITSTEEHGGGATYKYINIYNPADPNLDNDINVLDVVIAVNSVIDPGQITDNSIAKFIVDINNDGFVNILDVVMLVGMILSE